MTNKTRTAIDKRVGRHVGERLGRLYEIGRHHGTNRLGLTAEEQEAYLLTAGWMTEMGLEVEWLPGGSLLGRLPGEDPLLPEVWVGSHLDTVPDGGRFDGALGVIAALEAVGAIAAGVRRPHRGVCVVAFRDEEGVRFGGGYFGSRALFGALRPNDLAREDSTGTSVKAALDALGLDPPKVGGGAQDWPALFIEAHIEQGPQLESRGVPLGVVTDIVGLVMGSVSFQGSSGHAGTVPMDQRADALQAAARFVTAASSAARDAGALVTIGELRIESPGSNVIPGEVWLSVDLRASTTAGLNKMRQRLVELAADCAEAQRCRSESNLCVTHDPVTMDDDVRGALARAVEKVTGDAPVFIGSGAGHDAAVIGGAGVPTGMIFVRSGAGGVSHSPDECTNEQDIAVCVAALNEALKELLYENGRDR